MNTQNETDVFEMLTKFQKTILQKKPSTREMVQEVQMMKYKIKPLYGDISLLDFKNTQFVEALWSLGKLDEFFQNNVDQLETIEQDVFFRLIHEMRTDLQNDLNKANLKPLKVKSNQQSVFEIEIYKERAQKLN